jgi:hypothetical protein
MILAAVEATEAIYCAHSGAGGMVRTVLKVTVVTLTTT